MLDVDESLRFHKTAEVESVNSSRRRIIFEQGSHLPQPDYDKRARHNPGTRLLNLLGPELSMHLSTRHLSLPFS